MMDDSSRGKLPRLQTERGAPPYFAGRKLELAKLHSRLETVVDRGESQEGLALVVGVPGAGKTQLGLKFAAEAVQRHEGVERIVVGTGSLEDPVGLVVRIGRVFGSEQAARRAADLDSRRTGGSFAFGKVFSRSHTREHVRHTASFENLLEATQGAGMWKRATALVLIVDELQTVSPKGMEALRVLHEGQHGCPILLVGIGLQHTHRILANPKDGSSGISRTAKPLRLECLTENETVEAMLYGMATLGRDVSEECARRLAAGTFGFPQHIHGHLEAACEAYDQHGTLATEIALECAMNAGERARADYYRSRLAMLTQANRHALFAIVRSMRDRSVERLDWTVAVEAVAAAGREDPATVMDEAVKHGVLMEDANDTLSFGIPSFHAHLLSELAVAERERSG